MQGSIKTGDRRKEPRHNARYLAFIKIGANLYGRGYTKDISLEGTCLESVSVFRLMRPTRAMELVGESISIRCATYPVALHGKVVRVDSHKGETAIAITQTTDGQLWHNMVAGLEPTGP